MGAATVSDDARQMTCLQVGRVQDGTIGVIGQDGASGKHHRFHPISPYAYTADSCSATDGHGAAFNNLSVQGAIASADVPWGHRTAIRRMPATGASASPVPALPAG